MLKKRNTPSLYGYENIVMIVKCAKKRRSAAYNAVNEVNLVSKTKKGLVIIKH